MNTNWNMLVRALAIVAACGLIGTSSTSIAQDGPSLLVPPENAPPQTWPVEPMTFDEVESTTVEALPVYQETSAPIATEIKAIPVARIDYDVTRKARKRFGGSPFVDLTMVTQNPADGCFYEIPMCLPACCTGEPKVDSRCGLLGRGVVKYCYQCGLEVEVKFRLRGDVEVEYGT